jgi:hypothetical protein
MRHYEFIWEKGIKDPEKKWAYINSLNPIRLINAVFGILFFRQSINFLTRRPQQREMRNPPAAKQGRNSTFFAAGCPSKIQF